MIDDEVVMPESSASQSGDDVIFGSVDLTNQHNLNNFDTQYKIDAVEEKSNSAADISVSKIALEDKKEAQKFSFNQYRKNTVKSPVSLFKPIFVKD